MTFDWTISVPVVISVATFLFAYFRTRRADVDERFKTGSERMDRHERRIQTLEERQAAAPGIEEMHRIELQISEIGGMIGRMEAVMDGNGKIMTRLESIVSRHEDHLLDGAKK